MGRIGEQPPRALLSAYRTRTQTTPGRDPGVGRNRGHRFAVSHNQGGGSGVKFLRRFFIRLTNLAMRRSADQRLQDEIAEHLAFQTEENMRAARPPAGGRRQAALKFGSAEAIRERHHAEQSLPWIENLIHDLRYAVRVL